MPAPMILSRSKLTAAISSWRGLVAAILVAGAMAGLAGGFLCVADVKIFSVGMTVGTGFLALAMDIENSTK